MSVYPKIILKKGKDKVLRRFHPWVFSGAIKNHEEGLENGQLVSVWTEKGNFLGTGLYQKGSIAVKILSFDDVAVDQYFWKEKLLNAYHLREKAGLINNQETSVYRLVNGEGDGLPGLIIDYYNGLIVIQPHIDGYRSFINDILGILKDLYKNDLDTVYVKHTDIESVNNDKQKKGEFLTGDSGIRIVKENGYKFYIDCVTGQKTGYFIDQRDNRKLLQNYSAERKVINLFSYTGGFTVYAIQSGALTVDQVDSSLNAIEIAKENLKINDIDSSNISSYVTEVNDFIKDISSKYDLAVIDPPAFAKHLSSRNNAIFGYIRLNESVIRQIKKGGIIFTFSCSQVVSRQLFESAVMSAAINAHRNVKILHHLSQPPDHPVSVFHPEGEYLKGLVLYVD